MFIGLKNMPFDNYFNLHKLLSISLFLIVLSKSRHCVCTMSLRVIVYIISPINCYVHIIRGKIVFSLKTLLAMRLQNMSKKSLQKNSWFFYPIENVLYQYSIGTILTNSVPKQDWTISWTCTRIHSLGKLEYNKHPTFQNEYNNNTHTHNVTLTQCYCFSVYLARSLSALRIVSF